MPKKHAAKIDRNEYGYHVHRAGQVVVAFTSFAQAELHLKQLGYAPCGGKDNPYQTVADSGKPSWWYEKD